MNFGDRLKDLINERGLSQKEFAAAISIASSTANNYIRGIREPDYATLKKMASFFHVSVDYLLGMENEKAEDTSENELLLIYRELDSKQKSFLIEQAKLLMRQGI